MMVNEEKSPSSVREKLRKSAQAAVEIMGTIPVEERDYWLDAAPDFEANGKMRVTLQMENGEWRTTFDNDILQLVWDLVAQQAETPVPLSMVLVAAESRELNLRIVCAGLARLVNAGKLRMRKSTDAGE